MRRYLFKHLRVIGAHDSYDADLRILNGSIRDMEPDLHPEHNELVLECGGQLAVPGLINAHDHLQFNLFSRIGDPPYNNAYDWGTDLHRRWISTIDTIHRVPFRKRLLWGAWKNLLSGVSFVVHHDPFSAHFRYNFPIDVLRRYTFAHSVFGEPHLGHALEHRKEGVPFLIHLAEGRDDRTAEEVTCLMDLGGLDSRTVAAHAVNISNADIDVLERTRTSVIWCPSSNMYLFGRTAPVHSLLGRILVALGTDSTLTGNTTLFDEMRSARETSSLTAQEIYGLVTESPRRIFGLSASAGALCKGGAADMFLLPLAAPDPYETVLQATPGDITLMMNHGRIVYFDESRFPSLVNGHRRSYLLLNGRRKSISNRQCVRLYNELRPFLGHYAYLRSP